MPLGQKHIAIRKVNVEKATGKINANSREAEKPDRLLYLGTLRLNVVFVTCILVNNRSA